jgi:hypothetical protein
LHLDLDLDLKLDVILPLTLDMNWNLNLNLALNLDLNICLNLDLRKPGPGPEPDLKLPEFKSVSYVCNLDASVRRIQNMSLVVLEKGFLDLLIIVVVVSPVRLDEVTRLLPNHDGGRVCVPLEHRGIYFIERQTGS